MNKPRELVMYDRQEVADLVVNGEERITRTTCPACEHPMAWCAGQTEIDFRADFERDEDGSQIIEPYACRVFHAHRLVCGACELSLYNPDEIKAAGLPISWTLEETVDSSEYSFEPSGQD